MMLTIVALVRVYMCSSWRCSDWLLLQAVVVVLIVDTYEVDTCKEMSEDGDEDGILNFVYSGVEQLLNNKG